MPSFQRYLTDSDRALDRDANTMLNARGYEGAGYIAQGYANMDVLPEQMMLQDLIQKRQQINATSRDFRKEQAAEDMMADTQDEFDGYSSFVSGLKALPEQERVARIRNRMIENPSLATNKLISEANQNMLAGDRAVLDAQSNVLKSKQNDLEMRGVLYDDSRFEQQAKLKDQEYENAHQQAKLTRDTIGQARHDLENGLGVNAGRNIFNMGAFGDDQKEPRDKLIKIVAQLSSDDKPESKDALRSLTDITGGMAIGRQVKQLKGYLVQQNADLLKKVQQKTGINMSQLPQDRAERDAFIMKAHDELVKKGVSPDDLSAFGRYVEKVKGFNDSEDALNTLTADFVGSIDRLDALRQSNDPADQRKFKDEMALINAKAQAQAGFFEREHNTMSEDFKREKETSEMRKRDAEVVAKMRSTNLAEKREARAQYMADRRDEMAKARDRFERAKIAQRIQEDQVGDSLGLEADASAEEIMAAFDKLAPPAEGGVSSKDY